MKKYAKKLLAVALTVAMLLTINGLSNVTVASAAKKSKAPKLSASKVTLYLKKSKTIKIKNKPKKAKVTWSSKSKKIATVSKKGKITAKNTGKTTVTCKLTYKKKVGKKNKKVTKKLTVKVTVKKKATTTKPTPTKKPSNTPTVTTPATETSNLTKEHNSANGIKTKDNGQMRTNLKSSDMMRFMGLGWNYGNSLEQSIPESQWETFTVADCETSANNLALTQENVDALKAYGFKNVRIPVAWSNLMTVSTGSAIMYNINEDYMNRVEEVMNYCLNDEMYVIINIHYDGDWWGQFGDKDQEIRDLAWTRYRNFWTQIANRYKEYSDRLIFESANEELGDRLNDDWRNKSTANKTGTLSVAEQYETMNRINQEFVNIVRKSGGNNASRYLLIAGYSTNIDRTCDSRFKMPTDTKANGNNRLSVSVHYYTPWNYCGGSEYHQGEGMASRLFTWGTDADKKEMYTELAKMKQFTDQGYGVIIGEFGVQTTAVDGIPTYFKELSNYCLQNGLCPVLWDNGSWLDREKSVMRYDDISKAILAITGATYKYEKQNQNTGMPKYSEVSAEQESSLTLKYTWEGEWKKNGGGNVFYLKDKDGNDLITKDASGAPVDNTDTISEDGKWTFHCNNYGYWAVIHSEELKNFTQPYIRVTCKADTTNKYDDYKDPQAIIDSSALMFASAEFKAANPDDLEKCTQGKSSEISADEEWSGKIFAIDKEMLKDKEILWLSVSNKPIITKIEIFDGPEVSYD